MADSRGPSIGLRNATNARDLGGYPGAEGRPVRRGRLYRADALSRLTDADIDAVGGLGLACLIDFRHPIEIELFGPDRLPPVAPGRVVSLPLFDPGHDVFTTVSAVLSGRTESVAHLSDGGGDRLMLELYRWFVEAPMARQAYGAALRLIAAQDTAPLLFHCTAGKDRTGWLAAVVLGALGVDRTDIVADYLRTNDLNASGLAFVMAALTARIDEPALLLPLLEARPEYLEESFAAVRRHYGDLDGYLRDGLGLEPAVLERLRANLLE